MKPRKHPPLLRHIEKLHGDQPWGKFLDAGTGAQSISWVQDLTTEQWTAVTGSASEAERTRSAIKSPPRPHDKIIVGNWVDNNLLKGEIFDTVLADYLLGAIEGFAPCFQPYIFKRLRPLTRNMIYVKGLEPYVPISPPESKAGRLVWEIGRFRDACVLLGGNMPYREYPWEWVVDHLKSAGFDVQNVTHFSIRHRKLFVNAQIDIALHNSERLPDRALAQTLKNRGEMLRAKALDIIEAAGALEYGRNYVIAAKAV